MAAELESLDLSRLIQVHVGLSLAASLSISPVYNLPVALYGLVVASRSAGGGDDSGDAVRQFVSLWAGTFILDIFWLLSSWRRDSTSLALLLILCNFVLKPVTILSAMGQLRQNGQRTFAIPEALSGLSARGNFGLPGAGAGGNGFQGGFPAGSGNTLGGGGGRGQQNGWSAGTPYHVVDEEEEDTPPPPPPRSGRPTAGTPASASSAGKKEGQGQGVGQQVQAEGGGYHTLE